LKLQKAKRLHNLQEICSISHKSAF